MIFQTIDTAVQRFEEIIIQNQDGLSLYSAEKVHVGTDDKPSEQEEFSLELQKELFENSGVEPLKIVKKNSWNKSIRNTGYIV